MKRIDFSAISIVGIDGESVNIDISRQLGNALYYSSRDYAMSELGADIYKNKVVELDEKQAAAVVNVVKSTFSYVVSRAVANLLSDNNK